MLPLINKEESKIIGIAGVRNAAHSILPFVKSLNKIVDSIVILDDFSTDNTVEVSFVSKEEEEEKKNQS